MTNCLTGKSKKAKISTNQIFQKHILGSFSLMRRDFGPATLTLCEHEELSHGLLTRAIVCATVCLLTVCRPTVTRLVSMMSLIMA